MKCSKLNRAKAALACGILVTTGIPGFAAEPASKPPMQLPDVVVTGEAEYQQTVQPYFLPEVQDTKIYSGKKASVLDLDAVPSVQANNYRQALALTPGLLISEETTPLVSLGYRGIGTPHRAQFMNVLKDGIPIHADFVGYPESYYTPPLETVDRIEFLRGGSGLMYGPQPAGSLNYVTYQPRQDREFSFRSANVFGSDSLFGTYNAVDGTVGRIGYQAYYNQRQSQGFRTDNSDYRLDGGHFKTVLDADTDSRWTLAFDAYEEEHGEPGGLTQAGYDANRDQATRLYDRFKLQRYVPSLTYDRELSEQTQYSWKSWGGYYSRWSRRQTGGGFGTMPTGTQANVELQEFYNFGTELRARHDYEGFGAENTLAGGVMFFTSMSPRSDKRAPSPTDNDGLTFRETDRQVIYGSIFAENKLQYGKFSITPGFRLENVAQDVHQVNYDATTGTYINEGQNDKLDVQPLFAVSSAYQVTDTTEFYGGIAQSYRPTIFTQTLVVPVGSTFASGDISPSIGWIYELGYRGTHRDWVTFDTSLFLVDLDSRVGGTVTSGGVTVLQDVGRTINYGWDAAADFDIIRALDDWNGTDHAVRYGGLSLYGNASLLSATQCSDLATVDGKRPQYAPEYTIRGGTIYRFSDRVKFALLGTFVGQHFATDDEDPTRSIPAYMVWDLTVEAKVWRENLSVVAGINNLFDEDYYARIRSDGIDPAYGRNFYAGFTGSF